MYLIDTDIIIYAFKKNENVINNFKLYANIPKAVSIVTYGELLFEAYRSKRKVENLAKAHRLSELFPIIDVSKAIIETFASLKADLSKKGVNVDDFDLLVGSTALIMNYTVVTNNEKYFRKIPNLEIVNWTK